METLSYCQLMERCIALAAENVELKESRKNLAEFIQEELDAEYPLNMKIETPATDAFLAEVRAQGVEMLTTKLQQLIDEGNFEGDEVGLIAGAVYTGADIAAQIRKGAES